jgi:hypothetical protein
VAALLPVPNVIKIQLHWSIGADTSATTHFFWAYTGTAPTSATIITMAQQVDASVNSRFVPMMVAPVTATGATLTDLTSASAAQGTDPVSHVGTRAGTSLPAGVCCLVNGLIGRRYRGGKPRFYLPFGGNTDVGAPQTWTAGAVTAFQAAVNNFVSDVNVISVSGTAMSHAVNVSYFAGFTSYQNPATGRWYNRPKPRSAPLVDQLLSFPVNSKFGSQRRRNLHST